MAKDNERLRSELNEAKKHIKLLQDCDDTSMKTIDQIDAENKLLARLASDKPEFFNPAVAMQAKAIRDRILKKV